MKIVTMFQSKGLTVFCKLKLHALSKKTVLKISLNPGLNLTIILGTGPRWITPSSICIIPHIIQKPNSIIMLLFILISPSS